jgi:hypothetical protein
MPDRPSAEPGIGKRDDSGRLTWALIKAAILSFSASIRLKPPWLPETMATSARGMRLARSRAWAGVTRALRAPVTRRTGTVIVPSSSSVRTTGFFGSERKPRMPAHMSVICS